MIETLSRPLQERPSGDLASHPDWTSAPDTDRDQTPLYRIRRRLAGHGLTLALNFQPEGWSWDIPESPLLTRRVFGSMAAALEHADAYTTAWYGNAPSERHSAESARQAA